MALQIRRGTDAERQGITPKEGELIYVTDTNRLYVGGKISPSQSLEQGGILVSGSLVNDTNPTLAEDLDLNGNNITGNGNININGTITATGNINLGDGVEDNVIVGGQIGSSLIPGTDKSYDLGANASAWKTIYTSDIAVETSVTTGDVILKGNITKDDSSVVYDGFTGNLTVTDITAEDINSTGTATLAVANISGGTIDDVAIGATTASTGAFTTLSTTGDITSDGEITASIVTAATFNGDLFGGSIFAEDSTQLIDTHSKHITNGDLVFEDFTIRTLVSDNIRVETDNLVVASFDCSNNVALVNQIALEGNRGSAANPEAVQSGDFIGALTFSANNGVVAAPRAYVTGAIDAVTGTNALPGRLDFIVNDYDGNWTNATAASFNSRGVFEAPTLKNTAFADTAARDAAHPTPEAGMIVFVTDGDGAGNAQFQGYDGSNWVALN